MNKLIVVCSVVFVIALSAGCANTRQKSVENIYKEAQYGHSDTEYDYLIHYAGRNPHNK